MRVNLLRVGNDTRCLLCSGVLKRTRLVKACLHRFCGACMERLLRSVAASCPACGTHIASRRSLVPDPSFDALVSALYGNVAAFEAAEEAAGRGPRAGVAEARRIAAAAAARRGRGAAGRRAGGAGGGVGGAAARRAARRALRRAPLPPLPEPFPAAANLGRALAPVEAANIHVKVVPAPGCSLPPLSEPYVAAPASMTASQLARLVRALAPCGPVRLTEGGLPVPPWMGLGLLRGRADAAGRELVIAFQLLGEGERDVFA